MAKFAALAALLAALLFVSLAAATHEVTASVTTVEVNEADENPYRGFGGGGRCREQFEMAQDLHHCEDFLREETQGYGRSRFGGGGGGGFDPYEGGRRFRGGGEGSRHLRYCCQQLRQMDDRCRCQGLREVVREQQMMGLGGGREDIERLAENLPQVCGFGHRCDIRRGSLGGRWE